MSHNPSSTFCHINFFLKQRKPARVCVSVSECVIVCCLNQSSWWPSGPEGSGRSSGGGMEGWRWNKAEGGCDLVGSRRRGGGRFEVVGGQETRLIHPLSPPRRTLGFFFLKSLFLCCSYFHRRSRASCVCPITSSSPRRVDLDGDEDNISSVFIHNYDVPVVGLIPTQRCDELFNTQHFREFSRTHTALWVPS